MEKVNRILWGLVFIALGVIAVSYTHLDVYKRQVYNHLVSSDIY